MEYKFRLKYTFNMNQNNLKLPSNKKFGLFFGFIFLCLSAYFFSVGNTIFQAILFTFSIIFIFLAFYQENMLAPINKAWMKFGMIIGTIIQPIILGILFYALFTPLGVIMQIFGRDELGLKSSEKKSFWKLRESHNSSNNFFNQQF